MDFLKTNRFVLQFTFSKAFPYLDVKAYSQFVFGSMTESQVFLKN